MRLFAKSRARRAAIEACMHVLVQEARFGPGAPPSLARAAFRLQRRLCDRQIVISFETAFYRLRRYDRARVFGR